MANRRPRRQVERERVQPLRLLPPVLLPLSESEEQRLLEALTRALVPYLAGEPEAPLAETPEQS